VYQPFTPEPPAEPQRRFSGAHTQVVALFADLRGFTTWAEGQALDDVAELVGSEYERVVQIGEAHGHHFHKFLGDGFIVLWEASRASALGTSLGLALAAARQLHGEYWNLAQQARGRLPHGYGVAITLGEAIRLHPSAHVAGLAEADFVGYPLNCASRLQSLADAFGTVVCSESALLMARTPGMGFASLSGELVLPDDRAFRRAKSMKGLKPEDKEGFRFVRFSGLVSDCQVPEGDDDVPLLQLVR
jgi:class 3 adenylate cyclase